MNDSVGGGMGGTSLFNALDLDKSLLKKEITSPAPESLDVRALDLAVFDPEQVPLPLSKGIGEQIDVRLQADHTLADIDTAKQEAEKIGVNIAKSEFFAKLFALALSVTALGVSIAATVLTGGAAVPLLIASGVSFTLAVGDAGCAFADWRGKTGGGEGLAMGSDAIANSVNAILGNMGVAKGNAQLWAKSVSIISRVVLVVGTVWAGITTPVSFSHLVTTFNVASKITSPIVNGVVNLTSVGSNQKVKQLESEVRANISSAQSLYEQKSSQDQKRFQKSESATKTAIFSAEKQRLRDQANHDRLIAESAQQSNTIRNLQRDSEQKNTTILNLQRDSEQKNTTILNLQHDLEQKKINMQHKLAQLKLIVNGQLTDLTQQLKVLEQKLSESPNMPRARLNSV